jgi:hypothetical protein
VRMEATSSATWKTGGLQRSCRGNQGLILGEQCWQLREAMLDLKGKKWPAPPLSPRSNGDGILTNKTEGVGRRKELETSSPVEEWRCSPANGWRSAVAAVDELPLPHFTP